MMFWQRSHPWPDEKWGTLAHAEALESSSQNQYVSPAQYVQ